MTRDSYGAQVMARGAELSFDQRSGPWREEFRATLALAWPLILANLTMQLIQATDVVLLGWLGPKQLAAAALGLSLSFGMILFALGVLTASSPMMASAVGARFNSVRDVRRTFRQALWAAALMTVPALIVLWNAEHVILAFGQEPELARLAGWFLRGYMWVIPSWMLFQVMRNFVSALERPGWVLVISSAGIPLNAVVSWALIFGHLGLPKLGLIGGGIGSAIVWFAMAAALTVVVLTDRQFRRFHLFGRFWRPDWPRFRQLFRLGTPIGLTMGFEGAVFSAAAYLMGNLRLGPVSVLTGARIEETEVWGEGGVNYISPEEAARRAAWVGAVTPAEAERRVIAQYGGRSQAQEVTAQSSFYSSNDRRLHFGLGSAASADLTVRWPNGTVEKIGAVTADQLVVIREGAGVLRRQKFG
jgi:Na+-driven multidrug efflux pump